MPRIKFTPRGWRYVDPPGTFPRLDEYLLIWRGTPSPVDAEMEPGRANGDAPELRKRDPGDAPELRKQRPDTAEQQIASITAIAASFRNEDLRLTLADVYTPVQFVEALVALLKASQTGAKHAPQDLCKGD